MTNNSISDSKLIGYLRANLFVSIEKGYAALTKLHVGHKFDSFEFTYLINKGLSIHSLLVFASKPYFNLF